MRSFLSADLCAALWVCLLAVRQPGIICVPLHCDFLLGLVGPIMSVFTFTDDLAVLGTNVEEISQLLNAEELDHKDTPVNLADTSIGLDHVSFSYDGKTKCCMM